MLKRIVVLEGIEYFQASKCLLGFSGGGDSVALFFLLLEHGVDFDLAIVNHGLRSQAQVEVAYALELGKRYAKSVHVWHAPLEGTHNLEARARACRYAFFDRLSAQFGYAFVLLAHHLNDKLEWFFMQLAKGASLQTLLGFDTLENRGHYILARPLLYTPKRALKDYLHANGYRYFTDHTNHDPRFTRNLFRQKFSDAFLEARVAGFDMPKGLKRSFQALHEEKCQLYPSISTISVAGVWLFKQNPKNLYYIDTLLKRLGYVLRAKQRLELVRQHYNTHIKTKNRIYCVGALEGFVFVGSMSPALQILPRVYREACRQYKIPQTLRHALYSPKWQANLAAIQQAKLTLSASSD